MVGHGTETCPQCGGYLHPLKAEAGKFWYACRECQTPALKAIKNTDRDFINATVYDYSENP